MRTKVLKRHGLEEASGKNSSYVIECEKQRKESVYFKLRNIRNWRILSMRL